MCIKPIRIKVRDSGNKYRVVPCGKCPKCLLRRAQAWIFRLQEQEKVQQRAVFLTLTYKNPPISANGFMTLDKTDVQKFMKRLRFNTKRKTIKYYFCGEYGSKTKRPHYHAIIFDVTSEEIDRAWSIDGRSIGHIYTGTVTGESIAYTTKYICKGKTIPMFPKDDRLPEFSLMSKNMGLNYLTKSTINWHVNNKASYLLLEGGYTQCLPRYYRDKIFSEEQREELNARLQDIHKESHEAAIKKAGSISNYYRNQQEAVIAAIYNDKKKQQQERTKI